MLYLYLLLCEIAAAAVIAVSTVLLTARARRNPGRAFKILSGTYAVLFAVRFVWRRDVYFDIIRLQGSPLPPALTVFALLAFWLGLAAGVLMMILPYRQTRLSAFLGVVFAAPAVLVNVAFFPQIALLLGGEDAKFFDARILVFALETAALLATCAVFFIRNIRKIGELKPRGGKRIAFCFAAVFFMLFFSMNSYFLRVLFGSGPNHIYLDFNLYHRLLLYGTFIFPLAGYFLLRGASENARVTALLYIALATMITYSNNIVYLERLKDPWNWPLHLCNTAMYIIPICLITRWEKLFYFTYFINVFGAGMAMLMPNYKDYFLFSPGVVNFWINHSMAFGMPLLIVALRVFPRPKLRQFGYSAAGFLFYFIIALVCNAWFSNYTETPVDFFFINDDFVLSKLGKSFSVKVLNIKAAFKVGNATLTFYPLYQPVFFVCYLAVGLAMWFVYDNTFIFADNYHRMTLLRLARKQDEAAFFKQMEGRGRREPFLPGGTEMIEIKNVYKRYAKSKYYAVAGVSLTVKTGEVFGFLGPNGAGKSTIIKSLVGIQQLTSGNIFVCGYDTERQSVDAKMNIGFVPDHYALYERLTGREYINYVADLYNVGSERAERIERLVSRFELKAAFDSQMRTYSHGMKQKIAIIAALVHNPKVWILDEPLTGLDPSSIFQVKEAMKEHAAAGNIVFFSSHIMDVAERLCDRVAVIKNGQIIKCADMSEIVAGGETLEKFYLDLIENTDKPPVPAE